MYRLYAQKINGGYEKLLESLYIKDINKEINKINAKDYYSYMVIKNDGNGDNVITSKKLYEEVKVEYGDIKTDIQVNATTFKPSKAKKKEELRKITRDYIDR